MGETDMDAARAKKIDAEIADLNALGAKLRAETARINAEARWYLAVVGSGATLAILVAAKFFL